MSLLSKFRSLLDTNLAQLEQSVPSRPLKIAIRNLRISVHVGRALIGGKHNERAAALTYFSLLALVPALAVVFSLFKAFGGMARVETRAKSYILDYLAYESQGQVSEWLDRFVSSFNAGTVGGVGMAALVVTLLLTLASVEDALNKTWGVVARRGWGMKLVVYWTALTVGPLLLGTSLAMTASLQSSSVVVWAQRHVPFFGLSQSLLPMVITSLALSAMYLILPAARVRWGSALTGGVVAGVVFELAKWLYAFYAAKTLSKNALYGSLAALPFFIIWLNYSWRIVLFGADVAHAVQYLSTDPTEETDPRTNQATREEAAVRIAATIAAAFAENAPPPTQWQISSRLLLPAHLTETLCQHLLKGGLIREVAGGRRAGGLVPGRPLEELSAADVVRVLRHDVGVAHWAVSGDSKDRIDQFLLGVEATAMATLGEVRWSELAAHDAPAMGARPPGGEPVVVERLPEPEPEPESAADA